MTEFNNTKDIVDEGCARIAYLRWRKPQALCNIQTYTVHTIHTEILLVCIK